MIQSGREKKTENRPSRRSFLFYARTLRNARASGVEIDLIAQRAGVLAFVEVKTRRTRRAGAPEESVDARKQARLVRGAAGWLRTHRVRSRRLRFDVVVCEVDAEGAWRLRHLEGAFDANP